MNYLNVSTQTSFLKVLHLLFLQMLHPKALHYPSGFPMPRSPPLFICSSPGPDPYRSHDNVYEELEHRPDSDSERAHHSDDEFAEDELSLPGERSFQKSSPDATTVATIYQERSNSSSNGAGSSSANEPVEPPYTIERNRNERNSLLSSSSSGNDNHSGGSNNTGRQIRNSNSSSDCGGSNSNNGLSLGLFRCRSSNNNSVNSKNNCVSRQKIPNTFSADEMPTNGDPSVSSPMSGTDIPPTIYDDRSLMSLPPSYSSGSVNNNSGVNSNNQLPNNNTSSSNTVNNVNNNNNNRVNNFYGPVDDRELSEVERRNRINSQLSSHPVATIFRERGNSRVPHHHHVNPNRCRTNPRSLDRRRYINPQTLNNPPDPNYLYQEPIFHEGMLYDACLSHPYSTPYQILPTEFSTFRHAPSHSLPPNNGGQNNSMAVYSRDSSFGSDSGYSHNTQNSNRSNTNNVMPNTNSSSNQQQESRNHSWWGRGRSKGGSRSNRGSRSGTLSSLNRDS